MRRNPFLTVPCYSYFNTAVSESLKTSGLFSANINCSKLTMETLEKGVPYVPS